MTVRLRHRAQPRHAGSGAGTALAPVSAVTRLSARLLSGERTNPTHCRGDLTGNGRVRTGWGDNRGTSPQATDGELRVAGYCDGINGYDVYGWA